jgi:hypothetical protein
VQRGFEGGPAGGMGQGHATPRGGGVGRLRRRVEERRGPGRGTDPDATEAGGAPCGNKGG